jgi:cellulose biosynthesis protein BcsQ
VSGKVIAVANMKGGVGKTTVVVGLAEALAAQSGSDVLVIDLDAQANASICLAGDAALAKLIEDGKTIEAFLADYLLEGRKIKFNDCIQENVSNVTHRGTRLPIALLAASPELRLFEQILVHRLTKQKYSLEDIVNRLWDLMKEQLKRTRRSYEYVVIDCPPGISALTDVSLRLADLVVVPTIPDFLSTYGLQAFCRSVWDGELARRSPLQAPKQPPHVLVTRRRQVREHSETVEKMQNELRAKSPAFRLFQTEIPEMIAIPMALGKIDHFPSFSGKWKQAAPVLESLANETTEALNGARA